MIECWPNISIRGPIKNRYRNKFGKLVTPQMRQMADGRLLGYAESVPEVFISDSYEGVIELWDEFCETQTAT